MTAEDDIEQTVTRLANALDRLSAMTDRNCIITFHSHGDPDAVCSAYLLKRILHNAEVVSMDNLSAHGKRVAELLALPVKYMDVSEIESSGRPVIVVDTRSRRLLSGLSSAYIVIDHHDYADDPIDAEVQVVLPHAYSTTQIIYYLYNRQSGQSPSSDKYPSTLIPKMDPGIATAVLLGILDDTMGLREGNSELFEIIAELLKVSDKSFEELVRLTHDFSLTNKVNTVKACRTIKYDTAGDVIIVAARAPSNEGSVTTALSGFADVVFVGSIRQENARVSARARFVHVNLLKIVNKALEETGLKGSVGGHPYALGVSLENCSDKRLDEFLTVCLRTATRHLKSTMARDERT